MLTIELVTLEGVKLGKEVFEVLLPTPDGQIAVFPNHAPLVSMVEAGVISVRNRESDNDEALEHYATNGGVVEINERRVRVLVDEAEHSAEIAEQEAEAALVRAQQQAQAATDQLELEKANQLIQVQRARLRVAGLRRRRRR